MTVWLNDGLRPASEPCIGPADRGLLLGDGLFETMLARAGAPLRFAAHWARLRAGAGVLGLDLAWQADGVEAACRAVLAANALADGVLRVTVTRGAAPRGVLPPNAARPNLLIAAAPLPPTPGPARAVIARSTRRNEFSPLSRVKSLNRLDDVLARMEAAAAGADEALLLNTAGRLAEASTANLFLAVDGRLLTPPLADGALPGIVRAELLAAHDVLESPLCPADLARAEEAFLSNALGVRPLVAVDGAPIGDGAPGPLTRVLSASLF